MTAERSEPPSGACGARRGLLISGRGTARRAARRARVGRPCGCPRPPGAREPSRPAWWRRHPRVGVMAGPRRLGAEPRADRRRGTRHAARAHGRSGRCEPSRSRVASSRRARCAAGGRRSARRRAAVRMPPRSVGVCRAPATRAERSAGRLRLADHHPRPAQRPARRLRRGVRRRPRPTRRTRTTPDRARRRTRRSPDRRPRAAGPARRRGRPIAGPNATQAPRRRPEPSAQVDERRRPASSRDPVDARQASRDPTRLDALVLQPELVDVDLARRRPQVRADPAHGQRVEEIPLHDRRRAARVEQDDRDRDAA